MILVLAVRFLDWLRVAFVGAAMRCDQLAAPIYRAHSRREARKAARAEVTALMDRQRRDAAAIEELLASARPATRVGSPLHRDR